MKKSLIFFVAIFCSIISFSQTSQTFKTSQSSFSLEVEHSEITGTLSYEITVEDEEFWIVQTDLSNDERRRFGNEITTPFPLEFEVTLRTKRGNVSLTLENPEGEIVQVCNASSNKGRSSSEVNIDFSRTGTWKLTLTADDVKNLKLGLAQL